MSKRQEQARRRNWAKARLLGMSIDPRVLTTSENMKLQELLSVRDEMIRDWDKNSIKLGFKPTKKDEKSK